jgi:hypothetical protein
MKRAIPSIVAALLAAWLTVTVASALYDATEREHPLPEGWFKNYGSFWLDRYDIYVSPLISPIGGFGLGVLAMIIGVIVMIKFSGAGRFGGFVIFLLGSVFGGVNFVTLTA